MVRAAVLLLAVLGALLGAAAASAQPPPQQEQDAFADMLRRTDPAGYARFTELRTDRDRAQMEVQRLQQQAREAGALRAIVIPQLRAAQRRWAESSIALIDFLDERDRRQLAAYQSAIAEITAVLDQRRQARDELEKTLRSE